MRYYLAYGSNLNIKQMDRRCPGARVVGTAEIRGYELLFKGSHTGAYLTIGRCEGGIVPAGVWAVDEKEEESLDWFAGCPNFYYKTNMTVSVKHLDGKIESAECFVYIMHEDRVFGVPALQYVHTCLEGYKDFGFNEEFLSEAAKKSGSGFPGKEERKEK